MTRCFRVVDLRVSIFIFIFLWLVNLTLAIPVLSPVTSDRPHYCANEPEFFLHGANFHTQALFHHAPSDRVVDRSLVSLV